MIVCFSNTKLSSSSSTTTAIAITIIDEIVLRLNDLTDWSHKLQPARVRKVTKVVDALNTVLLGRFPFSILVLNLK